MRILEVTQVIPRQGFSIFHGVVIAEILRTGDSVALVDAAGSRDLGMISSIAVEDPIEGSIGARMLDVANKGQAVRITVRCRTPTIAAGAVIAIETP